MKRGFILITVLLAAHLNCSAQLYFTKNGKVSFFSSTPMEDIKADNNQVISIINTLTGEVQFSLLNNAFHFKKALMEEHFNADYMESAKYPKSTFKGTISNMASVNLNSDGDYKVTVTGSLSIHGVTRAIAAHGIISVKGGKISANSVFKVKVKDFNISIPSLMKNNVAEFVELTVNCSYEKKS